MAGSAHTSGSALSEPNRFVDRKTAAGILSVSVRTVDNLLRSSQLRPRRIGARVLILRSDLENFMSAC